MTRIELGPIPEKACQCQHCGRVKVGREWVRDDTVKVDVIGICPTCGQWQAKLAKAKAKRESEQMLRERAKGYHLDPSSVPWDDMKRGE